jgi:microcystin degradation protein MlrC
MWERGREAGRLLIGMLRRKPATTVLAKLPLLSCPLVQHTDRTPMRDVLDFARSLWSDEPRMRRVSLLPGFPYCDVERAGFSIILVADPEAERRAEEIATAIVAEVERRRNEFTIARDDPATAVARAIKSTLRPVVLVDVADNVGGGAPGDGTAILTELLAQRACGAVVTIADAEVARAAAAVGSGGRLAAEVGGKTDSLHGESVRIRGRVLRTTDGRYRAGGSWMTGIEFSMGTTALIEAKGVLLVVTEHAVPPFHVEQLRSVGVEPADAAIITAKGAVAWRAAYGDVAREVIEVATPGICPIDPASLPRASTPMRFNAEVARL